MKQIARLWIDLNPTVSIIIKCKYLNIPIKRQRFSDWIKKRTRSNYMKLTRKLLET